MPALVYPTSRASATALSVTRRRTASLIVGAGASSSTFWCRRWVEQSRSWRCTTLPWWSARTWTSMWRPCSTNFSTRIVSSPKADSASRLAAATASSYSSAFRTIRMPLPPPPAAAFTRTGYGACSPVGTTGTPAFTAISRAASLRPICSITAAVGPTSRISTASRASAKAARSERNPYPGWTASASTDCAAATTASMSR